MGHLPIIVLVGHVSCLIKLSWLLDKTNKNNKSHKKEKKKKKEINTSEQRNAQPYKSLIPPSHWNLHKTLFYKWPSILDHILFLSQPIFYSTMYPLSIQFLPSISSYTSKFQTLKNIAYLYIHKFVLNMNSFAIIIFFCLQITKLKYRLSRNIFSTLILTLFFKA